MFHLTYHCRLLPCCDAADQSAYFCYHMLTFTDFFKQCHVRRYWAERPATFPSPPTGLYIFSQCPQTLTAAGAEVWVGAHYSLVEPCQKEGRVFLKGVNWGFLFWVTYFVRANPTPCVVWSVPCVVCVPPAVFTQTGSNFRSPSFNELPSRMCLFQWNNQNFTQYLVEPHFWRFFFFHKAGFFIFWHDIYFSFPEK